MCKEFFMQIQPISNSKQSFGFKKTTLVKDVFNQVLAPIENATQKEKMELCKSLGITRANAKTWRTNFESHGGDIISGEFFPNIHVTTSGVSPIETFENIMSTELARIRGQLKRIPMKEFNL